MIEETLKTNKFTHLLIMGDFNFPEMVWSNRTAPGNNMDDENHSFLEILKSHFLFQHVTKPTRARCNQTPHLLNLIITNEEEMVTDLEYCSPLGASDHSLLKFKYNCYTPRQRKSQTKYNYNRGDYDTMRQNLRIDWDEKLKTLNSVEGKWKFFKAVMTTEIEKNIPQKKQHTKQKKSSPLSQEVLKSVRRKHRLWQRYLETRDGQKYQDYCKARNKVKKMVRRAKCEYEQSIARESKENPKKFWSYVNSKTKTRSTIPDLEVPGEDRSASEDEEKADTFLNYFGSVFTKEDLDNIPDFKKQTDKMMEELEITKEKIFKVLKNLKTNKSPGPDGLHPKVLNEVKDEIVTPLFIIFTASIETGEVPQDWKDAHISAIFKKGERKQPSNYRPVSLTSIVCKILETIIREHIVEFMKENNLFSKSQYGFISGRSTTLQLLNTLDKWTELRENGGKIDAIYFDYMKCFDTVPHQRLLKKLPGYGMREEIVDWIGNFLQNRRQRVVVNGEKSEWGPVISGIPQGSILGPLLFVLYINDLPDLVKSSTIMLFADDSKIFKKMAKEEDPKLLQKDVDTMCEWSAKWLLRYHPDKCKYMRIGPPDDEPNKYMVNGHTLSQTKKEKDLGVIMDQDLKFAEHTTTKVNLANKIMGVIRRSFTYLDKTIFTRLYKSLVRPHLEYAHSVYYPHQKDQKTQIENVQRRATKQLSCCKGMEYEERLRHLKLPCLLYRRLRGDMIEAYKMFYNKYDPTIDVPITKASSVHSRQTRGVNLNLHRSKATSDLRKLSFHNRVVAFWNELPTTVRSAPSIKSFERRLDKYWGKYRIAYDFDKCMEFEKQRLDPNYAGSGQRNLKTNKEEDMELQSL